MDELFKNLGLKQNPFSKFSAEEEKEYLDKIYECPKDYLTILSDVKSGSSRYIMGDRGFGKSALMYKLTSDLEDSDIFSVLIDCYDEIPLKDNGTDILCLLCEKVITSLGIRLLANKRKIKSLNNHQRDKLSFLLNNFFESLSPKEIEESVENITKRNKHNFFRKVFNYFLLKPINIVISSTSDFIGSTVSKSLGLPQSINNEIYKEFIKELEIAQSSPQIDLKELSYKDLKNILKESAKIIDTLGYGKTIIFFDKIDEYRTLESSINKIADFLETICTDTEIIYFEIIGFEFILWNKVKAPLSDRNVRFDKAIPINIVWTNEQLKNMVDSRLGYFSDKKITSLESILNKDFIEEIISLASGSPRQLIQVLSHIYNEQNKLNSNVSKLSDEAIINGEKLFCQTFEYKSLFPTENIVSNINKLTKVGKIEFQISDLTSAFKVSSQTGNSWVWPMQNLGLIEEIDNFGSKAKKYRIIDPKIAFLITNNLSYIS